MLKTNEILVMKKGCGPVCGMHFKSERILVFNNIGNLIAIHKDWTGGGGYVY